MDISDFRRRPLAPTCSRGHYPNYLSWGKIVETTPKHHVPNSTFDTVTIVKRFFYDHAGRLDTVQMSVNKAPFKVVAINQYNELGQLIHKKTHQTSASEYLVNTTYAYNIPLAPTCCRGLSCQAFRLNFPSKQPDNHNLPVGADLQSGPFLHIHSIKHTPAGANF